MAGGSGRPRAFLHVGLPKTGTSYLQSVLWQSRDRLADGGLVFLPERWQDHIGLALDVREMFRDFDDDRSRTALERTARQAADVTGRSVLISQEALAPATPEQVRRLVDALGDREVHVIVTVRDPGRQIPSAWQQRVQSRATYGYSRFVDAVLDRGRIAEDFWRNQDLPEVLENWSAVVPAARVHVVTCPPPGTAQDVLLTRFCSVIGVDPAVLDTSAPGDNTSIGQVQAEVLRRVNLALGDRLPHVRAGYRAIGREYLAGQVLRSQGGAPARLPAAVRPRLDELVADWRRQIDAGGYDVVGDLADLEPRDAAFVVGEEPIDDGELLASAAAALADVLVDHHDALARTRELERRVAALERGLPQAPGTAGLLRRLARRIVGRS